jgi:hypothetical protein
MILFDAAVFDPATAALKTGYAPTRGHVPPCFFPDDRSKRILPCHPQDSFVLPWLQPFRDIDFMITYGKINGSCPQCLPSKSF